MVVDILQDVPMNNTELKEGLEMKENETAKRSEQIVTSVKYFVKLRLTKSKTKKEKEAIYILINACTCTHSGGDDHNSVHIFFGFSTDTFYQNIMEQSNWMDMTRYTHIEKNKRKQTELSKIQE